jgi:hypothetical protein
VQVDAIDCLDVTEVASELFGDDRGVKWFGHAFTLVIARHIRSGVAGMSM